MTDWLSFHLFSAGDLDGLLVDGVRPVVAQLQDCGAIDQWFYVRYWNGGRHLRVRVQPTSADIESLSDEIRASFADALAASPAGDQDAGAYTSFARSLQAALSEVDDLGQADGETAEPLQPSGTVQLRPYIFEERRYGGAFARELLEGHFWRSSELASTIVAHSRGRMEARVSLAFELLAAMPASVGLEPKAAAAVLREFSGLLRRFNIGAKARPGGTAPRRDPSDTTERSGAPDLGDVANELWRAELAACHAELSTLWSAGRLTCPPHYIEMSMVHMFNNRLGISTTSECAMYESLARELAASATALAGPGGTGA